VATNPSHPVCKVFDELALSLEQILDKKSRAGEALKVVN
jgi:hypothetical protein